MTSTGSLQLSQLARDLHRMGPAIRREIRAEITRAAQGALSDARSRAGAWSRRIPAGISVRPVTNTGRGQIGAELRVGTRDAPHARPFEGIGGGAFFRHPVYGNPGRWVAQAVRPYALPAVRGRQAQIEAGVAAAFDTAARDAGFR